MNWIDRLKERFCMADVLTRLLFINLGVYILALLLDVTFTLFSIGPDDMAYTVLNYPYNPIALAIKPWSLITSMFTSWGLWHLLFNLFTLYWLGGAFLRYYTSNNLRGLYVLGALAGMVVFTVVFMTFPSLQYNGKEWPDSVPLCSAAVLCFSVALAFVAKDSKETLPLIGQVKIRYIVIAIGLIDISLLPHDNYVIDLCHLAAAAVGMLFWQFMRKGKDITAPVTAVALWIDNLIHRLCDRKN